MCMSITSARVVPEETLGPIAISVYYIKSFHIQHEEASFPYSLLSPAFLNAAVQVSKLGIATGAGAGVTDTDTQTVKAG